MAGPKQKVTSAWARVKKDILLPDAVLKRAAKDAATAQVDVIRQRALVGLGPNGKPFRRNSKEWTAYKRKIMSGKVKYPEWAKKTALAMTDPKQVGRLTGRTIADFTFTGIKTRRSGSMIELSWSLGVRSTRRVRGITSAKLVEILEKRHRIKLFGASTAGHYKVREEEAIRAVLRKSLALNPGASHQLTVD